MSFAHLAQHVFNVPLAIRPDKAEIIMASLAERWRILRIDGHEPLAFAVDDEAPMRDRPRGWDYAQGVAVIHIAGTLVQKQASMRPYSGMTGYNGIRANFLEALAEPSVRAIALDIDSPGGEVSGCFDLADLIYECRGRKPIWAILDEMACSAAYALASAADRVTVPRTGVCGSVGVIVLHAEITKALDQDGVAVTVLRFGDRKAEGNQFEKLTPAVRGRIQADVDKVGQLFANTVARNRGLKAQAVIDTEADIFLGPEGLAVGFADAVLAPADAFAELVEKVT